MGSHRAAIAWTVLAGLIIAAFAVTVLILNSTLYSAAGYTQSYLSALSRHDVSAALDLAGAPVTSTTISKNTGKTKPGTALLDPRALSELHDIHLVSDVDHGNGVHAVRFAYTMIGPTGKATASASTFEVRRDGVRMGLFSGWRFAQSPLGTLAVTPQNDAGFTVNGLQLSSSAPGAVSLQRVLTPGLYTLGNDSTLFTATPVYVEVSKVGGAAKATVTVRANPNFVAQVQDSLNEQLAKCATQKVLLPTGCPFGKEIGDRIEGTPTWSIVRNPTVTILPGSAPGTWQVPRTHGTAHLVVTVRSLFDGSLRTLDDDVPFTVSYAITFKGDGQLVITSR